MNTAFLNAKNDFLAAAKRTYESAASIIRRQIYNSLNFLCL